MFSALELMIAFRYLRAKRKEGFISVIAVFSLIGIALGVATLIVVMAVMNGFRAEITDKILGLSGHINIYSYDRDIKNYQELKTKLSNIDGVVQAVPMIDGQSMVTIKNSATGVLVKALEPEDLISKLIISDNITSGSVKNFTGKDAIIMGSELAMRLRLKVGDKVKMISPEGNATILGTIPRAKQFTLVATFNAGMYEYDSSAVFMTLEAAKVFFKYYDAVNTIELTVTDPHNIDEVVNKIIINTNAEYRINDWQMANSSLFNALKVERRVMFLILTLIILIAAFNIISSLIMLVNDKSRDIAILRTMGATKATITRIFFLCGSSVGLVGTFLGFILGISFALNIESIQRFMEKVTGQALFDPVIYFLSALPAEVKTQDVINVVIMALTLSFLATIYPALKAAKQDPAEALRYE